MFLVIFEVQPKKARWDDYLKLAKLLKPELERIDGFIDNERFISKRDDRRLLSLSTWRDEKAIIRWRTLAIHHRAQEKGRFEIFDDYHLRVGEVTVDTQIPKGEKLRQQRFDETEVGNAKLVSVSEFSPAEDGEAGGGRPCGDARSARERRARAGGARALREHRQSRQAVASARMAGRGRRGPLAAQAHSRHGTASSASAGDPRLRHVRPPRGAAALPGYRPLLLSLSAEVFRPRGRNRGRRMRSSPANA